MEILTAIGTVLGIAATLLLRDYRDGKNIFNKNVSPQSLAEGYTYMKHHYNDELTSILTEIQVGQKEQAKTLDRLEENLDDIRVNGIRIRT